jgi:acetylornithine deacetylase/succinyl-diaminopimelate desuccinylase family protein
MKAHVDEREVVDLTARFVRVDTRNPPGNEATIVDACREALAPFTDDLEVVEPQPGRASVLARVGTHDGSKPVVVVNGHLDVVPINAGDWTRDPFGAEEENGRLWGRGTTDMKGGIAAAICALHTLRRQGIDPATDLPCHVAFHLVADEERGGRWGTEVLVAQDRYAGVAACLVPEPTNLDVCVAERGLLVAHMTTFGRPAHGSRPREGVSAIETAAKAVLTLHAGEFGDPDHPLLGRPTCNIGEIQGGSGHNTVAESCRVTIARRLLPGATLDDALAAVRARLDTIEDPDLRYELEVETFGEASEMSAEHPIAAQVGRAIADATGRRPDVIGMPFTTDARFVRNQAGVPAVVCGPGRIDQAHVNDEYVEVAALVDATAAYATFLAGFAV